MFGWQVVRNNKTKVYAKLRDRNNGAPLNFVRPMFTLLYFTLLWRRHLARAPPLALDGGQPLPSPRATPLELRLVVDHLDEDDAFAFPSTCRAFRAATCLAGSAAARFRERGIRTSVAGVWSSTARLRSEG